METIKKSIKEYTKAEIKQIPRYDKSVDAPLIFDSLLIIPTNKRHDSGYRTMKFVAIEKDQPLYSFSGCSDVLDIDGIGGYGEYPRDRIAPYGHVKVKGWKIDVIDAGYLRLFCNSEYKLKWDGISVSSMEIYGTSRRIEKSK